MSEQKFPMKYKLQAQFGSFTNDEALKSGPDWGTANALLVGIMTSDGKHGTNAMFTLIDGEDPTMQNEPKLLTAWILLTRQLAESKTLNGALSKLPKKYMEEIRQVTGMEESAENTLQ